MRPHPRWLGLLAGMLTAAPGLRGEPAPAVMNEPHLLRLLDVTAGSAFEEAAARLEATLPPVAIPASESSRDLQTAIPWPGEIDPEVVRGDATTAGFDVSRVKVRSGSWVLHMGPGMIPESRYYRECGIIELEVTVGYRGGTGMLERTLVTRRQAAVRRVAGAGGVEELRIRIRPIGLTFRLEGAGGEGPPPGDEDPATATLRAAETIRRDIARMLYEVPMRDLAIFDEGRGLSVRVPKTTTRDFWNVQFSPVTYRLTRSGETAAACASLERETSLAREIASPCCRVDMVARFDPAGTEDGQHFLLITLLGAPGADGTRTIVSTRVPVPLILQPEPFEVKAR